MGLRDKALPTLPSNCDQVARCTARRQNQRPGTLTTIEEESELWKQVDTLHRTILEKDLRIAMLNKLVRRMKEDHAQQTSVLFRSMRAALEEFKESNRKARLAAEEAAASESYSAFSDSDDGFF